MDIDEARAFLREHNRVVLATRRRDGRPALSPMIVGVGTDGRLMLSSRETAMKTKNMRRDPAVSLCGISEGFFGQWVQVDGTAEVVSLPAAMDLLVEYYKTVAGEHEDWDEYRAAMEKEQRVMVLISIERAGPNRSG